jgi:hypothetical protein
VVAVSLVLITIIILYIAKSGNVNPLTLLFCFQNCFGLHVTVHAVIMTTQILSLRPALCS